MKRFLWLAVLLAACSPIPKYERPALCVPNTFGTDGSCEVIAWKEYYKDAKLQALVEKALVHSRDMAIAALNVEAASKLYAIAAADFLPKVDATLRGTYTKNNTTTQLYESLAGLSNFELDVFGRIRAQAEAAQDAYTGLQHVQDAVKVALVAAVASSYYGLAASTESLEVARTELTSAKKAEDLLAAQFAKGVGTELPVLQAKAARLEAERQEARFVGLVDLGRHALQLLTGEAGIEIGNLSTLPEMASLPIGLPSDVLLKRPDIAAAEYEIRAANANVGAARAAFFPRLSLTAFLGVASPSLQKLLQQTDLSSSVQGAATLPIWDWQTRPNQAGYAEVQKKIAIASYEKAVQNAFREVCDQLTSITSLVNQQASVASQVGTLERSYTLASQRYQRGLDNYLPALDAQRAHLQAKLSQIALGLDLATARITLYKTLGQGSV